MTETSPASLVKLGDRVLSALPPAFVMLVLVNLLSVGAMLWFAESEMDRRSAILDQIITRCLH